MKKNNAFTLIELLVVVAVIAIIAAFLFPAIAKAMENGRAKEDANNLKNLGQGIQMYLNDHDDSFFDLEAEAGDTWPIKLKKRYVPDWKSFRSPFDKATTSRPKREEDPVPISYGLNQEMMKEGKTFRGKWTAPPSSLVMAAPAVDTSSSDGAVRFRPDALNTSNVTVIPAGQGGSYGTHQAREVINVLFSDGHVDQLTWKKYSDSSSDRGIERWYPMGRED